MAKTKKEVQLARKANAIWEDDGQSFVSGIWNYLEWKRGAGWDYAKFLLQEKKSIDLNNVKYHERPILFYAATGGSLHSSNGTKVVKLLVENGADVNCLDLDGKTPLFEAIWYGNIDSVHYLIKHGAKVNIKSTSGWTPLHAAVTPNKPNIEIIKYLLDNGADLTAQDSEGKTPIDRNREIFNNNGLKKRLEEYLSKVTAKKAENEALNKSHLNTKLEREANAKKTLEEAKQKLSELRTNITPLIQNEFSNPGSALVKSLSPEERERLQFVVGFIQGNPIITQMNLKDIESVRSKLALNNQGTPNIIVKCQELQAQKQSQIIREVEQESKKPLPDKKIIDYNINAASNARNTRPHLSNMTGEAAIKRQNCLDALRKYKAEREKEASRPLNFFRNAFGKFDSDTKINCVDKMIDMLETDKGIHFEKSDRAVMQDGRLGKIFKEYEKSIFTLDNFKVEERINNLRNNLCDIQPKCDTDLEYNYILRAADFIKEKAGGNRQKERELIVDFAVKYTPADLKDEAEFRKQYLPEIINVANKTNATPVAIQNNMPQKVSSKAVGVPQADIKVKEATVFKEVKYEEEVTRKNNQERTAVPA